jgi:hypothetical protein
MLKILAMTFLCLCVWVSAVCAELVGCNNALSRQADSEISHLKTWGQIYESFRMYSACNEGVIAEGFSDAAVQMLTRRWNQLGRLRTLAARDTHFRGFVFEHIDATTEPDDLLEIVTNASRRCPPQAKNLCDGIRLQAAQAGSKKNFAREKRARVRIDGARFQFGESASRRICVRFALCFIIERLVCDVIHANIGTSRRGDRSSGIRRPL